MPSHAWIIPNASTCMLMQNLKGRAAQPARSSRPPGIMGGRSLICTGLEHSRHVSQISRGLSWPRGDWKCRRIGVRTILGLYGHVLCLVQAPQTRRLQNLMRKCARLFCSHLPGCCGRAEGYLASAPSSSRGWRPTPGERFIWKSPRCRTFLSASVSRPQGVIRPGASDILGFLLTALHPGIARPAEGGC